MTRLDLVVARMRSLWSGKMPGNLSAALNRLRRLAQRLLIATAILAVFAIFSFALRVPLLTGIAGFLMVEDSLTQADFIYVLTGGPNERPFRAAELYHQNLAPQIVLPQAEIRRTEALGLYPNETDVAVQTLRKLGVPDSAIQVVETAGGVTSTIDEARLLHRIAATELPRQVIVITSAHHTRRARWILRRQLADSSVRLTMVAANHIAFSASNWWKSEAGLTAIVNEYMKLAYYRIKYWRRPLAVERDAALTLPVRPVLAPNGASPRSLGAKLTRPHG